MPNIDRVELAQQLHALPAESQFPLFLLSSCGNPEQVPAGLFARKFTKPIKPAQLYRGILDCLVLQVKLPPTGEPEAENQLIDVTLAERSPHWILVAEDNVVNQRVVGHLLKGA